MTKAKTTSKRKNNMPKLDPEDQITTTAMAPAPLPQGVTPATTGGFGGFNSAPATTPAASGFGSTSGFGSPAAGTSSFGSSGSGFGSSSSGFGSSGGFGSSSGSNSNQQSTADAAAAFGGVMSAQSSEPPEHWMKAFWRPAMGWLYMLICFADFVAFPLLSMFLPLIERGFGVQVGYTAWQSLTLSNGGLIHLAFGAILGVSAYGRTQEKKTGTS